MSSAERQLETQNGIKWSPVLWAFTGSLVTAMLVLYQMKVSEEWEALPEALPDSITATEARLVAIEDLMERHPVWIGSLEGQKEQSRLDAKLTQLKTNQVIEQTQAKGEQELALLGVEGARQKALTLLKENRFQEARDVLQAALASAPASWNQADQVRLDIASIEKEIGVTQ